MAGTEKKKEIGKETTETITMKPEKEPQVNLADPENKGIFERLSDKAKSFGANLYEKAKINIVDRAKIMYNEDLFSWHDEISLGVASKIRGHDQRIGALEKSLVEQDRRLDSYKKRFGKLPPDLQEKVYLEKQNLERQKEILKNQRDRMQTQLEFRNNKKSLYENRRNEIAQEVNGRIQERFVAPREKRIESLQEEKAKFDQEIYAFVSTKTELEKELTELKSEVENVESDWEKDALGRIIKELQSELKESNNYIKSRLKERAAIEKKLVKLDKKANNWRDYQNEFARVTQRTSHYPETGEKPREKIKTERREISAKTSGTTGEITETKPIIETKEEIEKLSASDYINEWNRYFRSEMEIKPKSFVEISKIDQKEELTIAELENLIRNYYMAASKEKIRPLKLKERELEKRLKTLRRYLIGF